MLTTLIYSGNLLAVNCNDYLDHFKFNLKGDITRFDPSLRKLCVETENLEYFRLAAQFYAQKYESAHYEIEKAENQAQQMLSNIDAEIESLIQSSKDGQIDKQDSKKRLGEISVKLTKAIRINAGTAGKYKNLSSTIKNLTYYLDNLQIHDFGVNYKDYGFNSKDEAVIIASELEKYVSIGSSAPQAQKINNLELIQQINKKILEFQSTL